MDDMGMIPPYTPTGIGAVGFGTAVAVGAGVVAVGAGAVGADAVLVGLSSIIAPSPSGP
jgi:hypothetical protein